MARQFTLTIPKPVSNNAPSSTDAQKFSDALYDELNLRFPTTGASSDDSAAAIITKVYGADDSKEFSFDRGVSREVKERTLLSKFGDGYEQRIKDGINTKTEKFSINFSNKVWYEAEVIAAFLDTKTPTSFDIVMQRETIKVVCESYSITQVQPEFSSVRAELRRVYET